jgi:hypothetical protein
VTADATTIPQGTANIAFTPTPPGGAIYAWGSNLNVQASSDLGKTWVAQGFAYIGGQTITANIIGIDPNGIAYAIQGGGLYGALTGPDIGFSSTKTKSFGSLFGGIGSPPLKSLAAYPTIIYNPLLAFGIDTAAPNILYASLTNLGIYRSDDSGNNWVLVNGSLQDLAKNPIQAISTNPIASNQVYIAQTNIGISVGNFASPLVTITAPATAVGDSTSGQGFASVSSAGKVTVSVSVDSNVSAGPPTYDWHSSCSGGLTTGSFGQLTKVTTWTAPRNQTGILQTCVLTFTASSSQTPSVSSSVKVAVRSAQKIITWGAANGSKILWTLDGLTKTGGVLLNDPTQTAWTPISLSDPDANGLSDLVWAYPDGNLIVWTMNGLSVTASGLVAYPGAAWRPVARGRFDGISRSGLLFQNQGWLIAWNLNGAAKTGGFVVGQLAAGWQVKFIADFDGDGRDDILAANDSTGEAKIFYSEGNNVKSVDTLTAGPGWSLAAIGDFDGTGKLSILWRNTNGLAIIWFWPDRGGIVIQPSGNQGVPVPMRADFDGDGVDDILWQYLDGSRQIMLMNGATSPKSSSFVLPPGNPFSAVLLTDLTGDGRSDILWRAPTGMTIAWSMNGLTETGAALLSDYGDAYVPSAATNIITWPFSN